jgi:hypothetical protein
MTPAFQAGRHPTTRELAKKYALNRINRANALARSPRDDPLLFQNVCPKLDDGEQRRARVGAGGLEPPTPCL